MTRVTMLVSALALLLAATRGADAEGGTIAGQYTQNAVFLGHSYVKSQSYVDRVPDLASRMQNSYMVSYWFTNAGTVDGSGTIVQARTELASVVAYLDAINDYELANGASFNVLAWLNASSSTLDISNAAVRSTLVNECKKLVSTSTDGSYIDGAARSFDGIMIDIEPSGRNDTYFDALKTLMDEIKAGIGPGKLVAFTPPKYSTNGGASFWSPTYYYYMARHVDLLCAMTYDSVSSSGAAYQAWMTSQVTDILRAVSGEYWPDGSHPPPANGVMTFIGLPAFPANAYHNPSYENIVFGAQGLDAAMTALITEGDPSQVYFQGAAVYLHGDGSGSDGYASWATDWWWFGRYWLRAW